MRRGKLTQSQVKQVNIRNPSSSVSFCADSAYIIESGYYDHKITAKIGTFATGINRFSWFPVSSWFFVIATGAKYFLAEHYCSQSNKLVCTIVYLMITMCYVIHPARPIINAVIWLETTLSTWIISKRNFPKEISVWKREQAKEMCVTLRQPHSYDYKGEHHSCGRECLLVESFISFCLFLSMLAFPASERLSMQPKPSSWLACVRLITAVIDGVRDDLTSSLNARLDICLPAVFACFSPVWSYLSCFFTSPLDGRLRVRIAESCD